MTWIKSKWDGRCAECKCLITAGEKIYYDGQAYCLECGEKKSDSMDGTP